MSLSFFHNTQVRRYSSPDSNLHEGIPKL